MRQYSFINEGLVSSLKAHFVPKGTSALVTGAAAGTLLGTSTGGLIGFLYGCKVYKDKRKTLEEIDKEILDPETSEYTRRQLIDARNMIMSMTDEEYRNKIVKDSYQKGAAIGGTVGTAIGTLLHKHL